MVCYNLDFLRVYVFLWRGVGCFPNNVQGRLGLSIRYCCKWLHCGCALQKVSALKGMLQEDPYFAKKDIFLIISSSATIPSMAPLGVNGLGRAGSLINSRGSNS